MKRDPEKDQERDSEMVRLFKDCWTLREIGDSYELSRERIRQILSRNGVTGKDGGIALRARKASVLRAKRKDESSNKRFGCPHKTYKAISKDKKKRFKQQKKNAKTRGIAWEINLYEWCCLWEERWGQRGRNHGEYVMARFGDKGSYSINNVEIVTSTENIIERCERDFGGDYTETSNRAIKAANNKKGLATELQVL